MFNIDFSFKKPRTFEPIRKLRVLGGGNDI